jgi:hypothetical protein
MTSEAAPVGAARRNLGRWSRRTLRGVTEVVLPRAPGAPELAPATVVDFIDAWVFYMPRLFRLLFPVGLMLLELGAFVLGPSLVPFSFMSSAARARYVGKWIHGGSRLRRDLIKGIKGLVLLAYYSDPRVADHLGYRVEEHVQLVKTERLRRYADQL